MIASVPLAGPSQEVVPDRLHDWVKPLGVSSGTSWHWAVHPSFQILMIFGGDLLTADHGRVETDGRVSFSFFWGGDKSFRRETERAGDSRLSLENSSHWQINCATSTTLVLSCFLPKLWIMYVIHIAWQIICTNICQMKSRERNNDGDDFL